MVIEFLVGITKLRIAYTDGQILDALKVGVATVVT
jgi:hypothetical protein